VGAALGDGGVRVVVDGEQDEAERVGDGGWVGEVGDGGREQEEVVALKAGGEVREVEGDDAVVDEAGPAEDGEVGADEHPLVPLLGASSNTDIRAFAAW
jgi:hypothetical protein